MRIEEIKRGTYWAKAIRLEDASGNTLPSVGVKTGDKWTINVKGLVTDSLLVGDVLIAKIDNPGQNITNWNHIYANQPKSVNLVRADATTNPSVVPTTGTTRTAGYYYNGTGSTPNSNVYTHNFNGNFRAYNIGSYGILTANGSFYANNGSYFQNANTIGLNSLTAYSNTNNGIYISHGSAGTGLPFRISIGGVTDHTIFKPNAVNGENAYLFDTYNSLTSGNLSVWRNAGTTKVSIDYTGKGTFNGIYSATSSSTSVWGYCSGGASAIRGDANYGYGGEFKSINGTGLKVNIEGTSTGNIAEFQFGGGIKTKIDKDGYLFNINPTFSSVFWDSTRLITIDTNVVQLTNNWGNLWPSTELTSFAKIHDTIIGKIPGHYNLSMNLNLMPGASFAANIYIKKRAANSTVKTLLYKQTCYVNGGQGGLITLSNIHIPINKDDRVWIDVQNTWEGIEVTLLGGTLLIESSHLNP